MRRALFGSTIPFVCIVGLLSAPVGCDSERDADPTEFDAFRSGSLITPGQWACIQLNGLGLRSGDKTQPEPWKGPASYAMAYGSDPWTIPGDFDERLENTLQQILGFPNSSSRTLYLNRGVYPSGECYQGSFPKSSSAARGVVDSIDIGSSLNELEIWVAGSIPEGSECDF